MCDFPEEPNVSEDERSSASMRFRYEDLSQDGRLRIEALPQGLGVVVWSNLVSRSEIGRVLLPRGEVPILTRLVMEGGSEPIAEDDPVDLRGLYQLAHTVDESGVVDRLLMNLWLTVSGVRGKTTGPQPAGAGEAVWVGRVFGEHVFTRLFAAREDRKVLRLDLPGGPVVPPERYVWRPPESVLELPSGATPLDDALVPDAAPVAFGLDHTDSNQHVNSMVYPRLFVDAALRRFAERGRSTAVLARRAEVTYRKPCFAGGKAKIVVQGYEVGGSLGAVGAFVPVEGGRPYCCLRVAFE